MPFILDEAPQTEPRRLSVAPPPPQPSQGFVPDFGEFVEDQAPNPYVEAFKQGIFQPPVGFGETKGVLGTIPAIPAVPGDHPYLNSFIGGTNAIGEAGVGFLSPYMAALGKTMGMLHKANAAGSALAGPALAALDAYFTEDMTKAAAEQAGRASVEANLPQTSPEEAARLRMAPVITGAMAAAPLAFNAMNRTAIPAEVAPERITPDQAKAAAADVPVAPEVAEAPKPIEPLPIPETLRNVIDVVPDASQFSDFHKSEIAKRGVDPTSVDGFWDPKENKVILNESQFRNEDGTINQDKLNSKIVHETFVHLGLRPALGEEGVAKLSDQIWRSLDDKERAGIAERNGIKPEETAHVGEEWLGYEAERVAREGKTNTVWTKIADYVRSALRSLGVDVKLSDTEIAAYVAKGKQGAELLNRQRAREGVDLNTANEDQFYQWIGDRLQPLTNGKPEGVPAAQKDPNDVMMSVNKPIKWKSPEESFYESEDGRFTIDPLYLGRERPQGWAITDKKTGKKITTYDGLKVAKEKAAAMLAPEQPAAPKVEVTEDKMRAAYLQAKASGHNEFAADIAKNAAKRGWNLESTPDIRLSVAQTKPVKEIKESDRGYGYWVMRNGDIVPVKDWAGHRDVAEAMLGTGKGGEHAEVQLQKQGAVRLVANGSGDGYLNISGGEWKNLSRAQRQAVEDIAAKRKLDAADGYGDVEDVQYAPRDKYGIRLSVAQTKTPEFKDWFGDWERDPENASKIVDKNGKPLVVYHGTGADFSTFSSEEAPYRGGVLAFFTRSKRFANAYAGEHDQGGNVMPVYLRIKNPFDYRTDGERAASRFYDETGGVRDQYEADRIRGDVENIGDGTEPLSYEEFRDAVKKGSWPALESSEFVEWLRGSGYDGLLVRENGAINYAVFDPSQIKSATGNRGTFDKTNPDIRLSVNEPSKVGEPAAERNDRDRALVGGPIAKPAVMFSINEREEGRQKIIQHLAGVVRETTPRGDMSQAEWKRTTLAAAEKQLTDLEKSLGPKYAQMINAMTDSKSSYPSASTGPLPKNSDPTYKTTVDLVGACVRMLRTFAVKNYLAEQGHKNMTSAEQQGVKTALNALGHDLNCLYCYAFTRRANAVNKLNEMSSALKAGKMGEINPDFSEKKQGEIAALWRAALAEAKAKPGWEKDLAALPDLLAIKTAKASELGAVSGQAKAFADKYPAIFNLKQKVTDPGNMRLPGADIAIAGQIAKMSPEAVAELKDWGGLRWQSNVDFISALAHDYVQGPIEMKLANTAGHIYTKEVDLPRLWRDNGIKINMSAAPLVRNGKVVWDKERNMPALDPSIGSMRIEDIEEGLNLSPKHGGIMMLGINDPVLDWLTTSNSKYAKYGIPWHSSGMPQFISGAFKDVVGAKNYHDPHETIRTYSSKQEAPSNLRPILIPEVGANGAKTGKLIPDYSRIGEVEPSLAWIADVYREQQDAFRDAKGVDKSATMPSINLPPGKIADQARGVSDRVATKQYFDLTDKAGMNPVFNESYLSGFMERNGGRRPEYYWRIKKHYARTDTPFAPPDPAKTNFTHGERLNAQWEASGMAKAIRNGSSTLLDAFHDRVLTAKEKSDIDRVVKRIKGSADPIREAMKFADEQKATSRGKP